MANEGDLGNKAADEFLHFALQNAKRKTGQEMLTGFCRNDCGEATQGAFCSRECRDDYNLRMRNKV